MASIKPFNGLLYNTKKAGPPEKLIAPPYDIISPREEKALTGRSKYNIAHIILPESRKGDTSSNNKYTRTAALFERWLEEGVLTHNGSDAVYLYSQSYGYKGKRREGIGFITLIKLEEPHKGIVFPHEHIHSAPKKDRFNLIKEVGANLSPIFSLFPDTGGIIRGMKRRYLKAKPFADISYGGIRHKLWIVNDPVLIKEAVSGLSSKKIFIVDGHHRYQAALEVKKYKEKSGDRSGRYDHVMSYLADFDERSLLIFPFHRMISGPSARGLKGLSDRLSKYFNIIEKKDLEALMSSMKGAGRGCYKFGLCYKRAFYLLGLKKAHRPRPGGRKWKMLDAAVFDDIILRRTLGISNRKKAEHVSYSKDEALVSESVSKGKADMGFLLNPVRMDDIRKIATAGEKMPQKSTYFYPKLLTGLVINKF